MTVDEQFVMGKSKDYELCEDSIVVTSDIIAVIDGVTAKTDMLYNGKKGGKFCADFIAAFLELQAGSIMSAEELFSLLSSELEKEVTTNFQDADSAEWPRASVIVFNKKANEIWSYGDCQCMINGEVYTEPKKIDKLTAELRALYLEIELLKHTSMEKLLQEDVGRNAILPLLKLQVQFENVEGTELGYPVINGRKINPEMIKTYKVKAGDEVVFATDGYPVLKKTLKESEEELSLVLQSDPMCFRKYKTTKGLSGDNLSYDDRAYCRFTV